MKQERVLFRRNLHSTVVTYPAPVGEPLSEHYAVEVNGEPVDVYTARVNDPPFQHLDHGGTYSFVSFSFAGRVTVTVRSLDPFRLQSVPPSGGGEAGPAPYGMIEGVLVQSARIHPLSKGIKHALVDEKATRLTLDRPCKLAFEPQGKRHPLLILAHALENDPPAENDPGVIYYGPGIHRPEGGVVELRSNQSLYLAGGAVVQAAILIKEAENVTIRGRGILCGNPWPHHKGPLRWFVNMQDSRNITIDGVIFRGSYCWTLVPTNCEQVTITDVTICGGRVWNDDGINPCNSRHVVVKDCFLRTDDDCFAPKGMGVDWGDVQDLLVENCALWCDRARVVLLGHESRAPRMRGIVFRDIDVLHYVQKIFQLEPGEEMVLENVLFEDWRIQGEGQEYLALIRPTVNQYNWTKAPGHIRDVRFRDFDVFGQPGACKIVIEGCDAAHRVEDVSFENVRILGQPVSADAPNVVLGSRAFMGDVTFQS